MKTPRFADQRGQADYGWLKAQHSFSFGSYQDPQHQGYSSLLVINEDRVAAGTGFAPHGHRDMEIITYPLAGSVRHKDSTGGEGLIRHGEIQVMHAGSGIRHSEINGSGQEELHLLQIWITPNQLGVTPAYEEAAINPDAVRNQWGLMVAPLASNAAAPFKIYADAFLWLAWLDVGASLEQALNRARRYYLHVAIGRLRLGELTLAAGDAMKLEAEQILQVTAVEDCQILLFDLP